MIGKQLFELWLYLISGLHMISIGGIAAYGCHRIWMLACWYWERKKADVHVAPDPMDASRPFVTIQLPMYNERFVAERLITAAARVDWPRDRFEIQVLDDSTDETRRTASRQSQKWRDNGVNITVLHRNDRAGYKAGALAEGMRSARGAFIAIFDADFMPKPDFLKRTIPHFQDPEVGMVQSRWGFLNKHYSWLTRIQSTLIGPHFSIEHWVRYRRRLYFNFNGTGGVWRRSAIDTAGGWRADTVTEDLDLSYRAQMAGWRFVYLNDVVTPSELPVTLSAFRTQQQRWAKGSVQTARRILPQLIRSRGPSPAVKFEACAHLLANLGWLFGAMATLLLYPMILSRAGIGPFQLFWFDIPVMGLGMGAILVYFLFYVLARARYRDILWLPLVPIVCIGMAPAIAMAVVQGVVTRGGHFDRTPKFGSVGNSALHPAVKAYCRHSHFYLVLDMLLALYTLLPIHWAWQHGTWMAIPFLLMFPAGFVLMALGEFAELHPRR